MSTTQTKRWVRKQLIALAQRLQRPGSGTVASVLLRRTARMVFPDLTEVLGPIPWAVVGGVATRRYMPERVTQDLDVVVRRRDAGQVRQRLATAGFRLQGELSVGGAMWEAPDGTPVDVLESDARWLPQALTEAQSNRDAQGLPVLPLPYLVLMKFQAGRVQDLADVTRMLGQADEQALEAVRSLFRQYVPDDTEDLASLIVLGQMELRGPEERRGEGGDGPSGR